VKLKTAFGARIVDCYQSWLNSRDGYTPPEPINSSFKNELGGGDQERQAMKERVEQERQEGIKRANKANFSLFLRSSRELLL